MRTAAGRYWHLAAALITLSVFSGCTLFADDPEPESEPAPVKTASPLDSVAEDFVRLALALGVHDADYVDAYHGPQEWREKAESRYLSIGQINNRAGSLMTKLAQVDATTLEADEGKRYVFLEGQLRALAARAALVEGRNFSFDAEARTVYDVLPPVNGPEAFDAAIGKLDELLPGEGRLSERLDRFRSDFVIPPERLDTVFRLAIDECARRTYEHIELPAGESFTLEYVTDKPWSGYNWYQGDSISLIQVNTDFPIHISRAVDLACHEGYPGHHVYNTLIEEHLVRRRGWVEFTLFPLFSPQGPIAEGSANFGIGLAFPDDERMAFERDVLFPAAGLDSERVAEYYAVEALADELNYAHNEAARGIVNGTMSDDEAQQWLMTYGLMSEEKAGQRVAFIHKYRAYVVNYNLGKDLVAEYVDSRSDSPDNRWQVFEALLTEPTLPSALVVK
ncbi:MAG: hypothetical protein AAFN78_17565 [Pseudomonadota bacterium]